jgi:multiple antibiotic resistance protein
MLYRVMGVAGLKALSRIMGFLVMAIGIQFIIQGVVSLVGELAA